MIRCFEIFGGYSERQWVYFSHGLLWKEVGGCPGVASPALCRKRRGNIYLAKKNSNLHHTSKRHMEANRVKITKQVAQRTAYDTTWLPTR